MKRFLRSSKPLKVTILLSSQDYKEFTVNIAMFFNKANRFYLEIVLSGIYL